MPQTKSHLFIELNEHSVVAARTTARDTTLIIEELQEHALAAKASVSQAMSAIAATASAGASHAVCTIRPERRFIHLSSREESGKHATAAAVREFMAGPAFADFGASALACASARSGEAIVGDGKSPWVAAGVPLDKSAAATAMLREWQIASPRFESATLSLLGAGQHLLRATSPNGTLLAWEIGDTYSDLFVVTADGVEAAKRVGFGFNTVIESLLAEITLKFKASASKLFFNELYDFSEAGPKIAARVAAALSAEIAALGSQTRRPATHFTCAGLPAKQAWFSQQLAAALKLAVWEPDFIAWSAKAGFGFSPAVIEAGLSPSWAGLIGAVGASASGKSAGTAPWHPVWFGDVTAATATPAPAAAIPAAAPVAKKQEAPAAVVAVPAVTVTAKPAPTPASAPRAATTITPPPAAAAKPSTPEPAPAKPARNDTGNAKDRRDTQSAKFPRANVPAKSEKTPAQASVAPAAAAAPAPATPVAAAPAATPAAQFSRTPQKRSALQNPVTIALVAVVIAVVGFGAYFVMHSGSEKAAALREKEQLLKQVASDAEARRIAEQKAEEAAEARRIAEESAAKTASMAQAERQRAEQEARLREIESKRLLSARGAVSLVTDPVGATIEIGNLAPRVSPATVSDLHLGRYTAVVSMPGFDPSTVDFEVKENQTTDPGPIVLIRQFGNLTVSSIPAGLNFEVRPVGSRTGVGASDAHWGTTPATIQDLPVGDYTVTLLRDGWPNRTDTVTVQKDVAAKVARNYSGGAVNLSSRPQGASVFANGMNLGVTPLVINDVPPGDVTYTLELPGHLTAKAAGHVAADKPLDLAISLEPTDRLATMSELDERPVPIKTVNPNVDSEVFLDRQSVIVSVIVDTDGVPRDLKIVQSTDSDLASRCLEAVTQWRFKPAVIQGKAVKTRVSIPFVVK